MRGVWIRLVPLVIGAALAGPAHAGVYITTEPWPQPRPFNLFQSELTEYRAAAAMTATAETSAPPSQPEPLAWHYVRRVRELQALDAHNRLSLRDRSDLGGYYLRQGKYQAAVRILEPGARQGDFLLLTNLATAYELTGQGDLALRTREQALAAWPRMYPGWDTLQVNFYRKAELYHRKLLQLRLNRPKQPQGGGELQFDNLFPPFVGHGNRYEVGGISPARWGELPSDALPLTEQLLLWLPFDDGLHWLLGELLNAHGDVLGAAAMMKPVVEKPAGGGVGPGGPAPAGGLPLQWNVRVPDELRQHYHAVAAVAAEREKYMDKVRALQDPYLNLQLLCAVAPRGLGLGAGDLMQEAIWPAVAIATEEQSRRAAQPPAGPGQANSDTGRTTPPRPAGLDLNWRQLGVGFGAGAVVALLLAMQFRQMGRTKT